MGNIFKTCISQGKVNLEEKIKMMRGSGLALKRKRKTRNSQSQGIRRKVNDIFTEEKKKKNEWCVYKRVYLSSSSVAYYISR